MYYVTMTDRFMSGWGRADGRSTKPSYPASRYMTSFKDINDYAAWRTPQPTWK
jgi:hypothetical protein